MKYFATLIAGVLLFSAAPAFAYDDGVTLQSAERLCSRTAGGRERLRCLYNSRRSTSRYRYNTKAAVGARDRTLREQRMLMRNKPIDNIRGRASQAVSRYHMRGGGRSRRTIHVVDRAARAKCKYLKGTKRFQCIRKRGRGSGVDNTQYDN